MNEERRFLRVFVKGNSRDVVGYMICRRPPKGCRQFSYDHISMSQIIFFGPGFSYAMHCDWSGSIVVRVNVGDVEDARTFVYQLAGKYAVDAIPCTDRELRETV